MPALLELFRLGTPVKPWRRNGFLWHNVTGRNLGFLGLNCSSRSQVRRMGPPLKRRCGQEW
jgi:hypothetical protein